MDELAVAAKARDEAYKRRNAASKDDVFLRMNGAKQPQPAASVSATSGKQAGNNHALDRAQRRNPTKAASTLAALLAKAQPSSVARERPVNSNRRSR